MTTAGEQAAAAIRWGMTGGRAPAELADLSTADQARLYRAGREVTGATERAVARAQADTDREE